jgi:hypothetical protein
MKNSAVIISLALIINLLFIFSKSFSDHSTATAQFEQGYYIFIESKPVAPYEYLGTITVHDYNTWMGSPKELFNVAMKRAKRDYPQANGLIFLDLDLHKIDAIKFKE